MANKNGGDEPPKKPPTPDEIKAKQIQDERKDKIREPDSDWRKHLDKKDAGKLDPNKNRTGDKWAKHEENRRERLLDKPNNRPALDGKVEDRKKELENQKSQEPDKIIDKSKEPEKPIDKENQHEIDYDKE